MTHETGPERDERQAGWEVERRRQREPREGRRPADADRRSEWERKWSRPDYAPGWRVRSIPEEIREAVETGWFPAGAHVLDIGCGSGEIGAWLAAQGYDVTGIDFAAAAIARARAAHPETERLRFEVADICRRVPGERAFGAMLDRGCLHVVPHDLRSAYIRNAAGAAKPGARFFLAYRVDPDAPTENVVANLRALCEPAFDVVRVADTVLGEGRAAKAPRRGVALWMIRSS